MVFSLSSASLSLAPLICLSLRFVRLSCWSLCLVFNFCSIWTFCSGHSWFWLRTEGSTETATKAFQQVFQTCSNLCHIVSPKWWKSPQSLSPSISYSSSDRSRQPPGWSSVPGAAMPPRNPTISQHGRYILGWSSWLDGGYGSWKIHLRVIMIHDAVMEDGRYILGWSW